MDEVEVAVAVDVGKVESVPPLARRGEAGADLAQAQGAVGCSGRLARRRDRRRVLAAWSDEKHEAGSQGCLPHFAPAEWQAHAWRLRSRNTPASASSAIRAASPWRSRAGTCANVSYRTTVASDGAPLE